MENAHILKRLIIVAFLVQGCGDEQSDSGAGVKRHKLGTAPHHWMMVQWAPNDDEFKKRFQSKGFLDDPTNLSAPNFDGLITIWINESPVFVEAKFGSFFRLEGFLKNGKNTITFSGVANNQFYKTKDHHLFAQIYLWPKKNFEMEEIPNTEYKFIAKTEIGKLDGKREISFLTQTDYVDVFDDLPKSGSEREQLDTKLRQWFKDFEDALANRQGEKAVRLREKNRDLLSSALGKERLIDDAKVKAFIKTANSTECKILNKSDSFKFVWGKKSVLVYSDDTVSDGRSTKVPVSWKYSCKGKEYGMPPLCIVSVNGKLAIIY